MNYIKSIDIFEDHTKKHQKFDLQHDNAMPSDFENNKIVKKQLGNISLYNGDSFKVLRRMPSNSISSALIDPPYGIGFMGHEWDNFSPPNITKKSEDYAGNIYAGSGRPGSVHAGSYDISYSGSVKFQKWCMEWAIELWRVLKPGAHILVFCSPRMVHRLSCGLEDAGFHIKDMLTWNYGKGLPKSHNISKAIAKKEDRNDVEIESTLGWGTGLKPAYEPIVLCQKSVENGLTIAENFCKWGTGGINIEDCRVGSSGGYKKISVDLEHPDNNPNPICFSKYINAKSQSIPLNKGRFPANVIFDYVNEPWQKFFYCPKTSSSERHTGCENLEFPHLKNTTTSRTYKDICGNCGKKFIGPEETRCQCPVGIKKTERPKLKGNIHPTVKPSRLLQHLVKLITPKDGTCLDIFMGSGSTGIACVNLGYKFIGIDKEADYFKIAEARITYAQTINNQSKTG